MRRNGRAAGASGLTLARDRRRQNLHLRAVVGWPPRSVSLAPLSSLPHARQSASAASATAPIAVCQASPLASGGWEQEQRRETDGGLYILRSSSSWFFKGTWDRT